MNFEYQNRVGCTQTHIYFKLYQRFIKGSVENGDPEVNNNPDLIWLKLTKHVKARNTRFY